LSGLNDRGIPPAAGQESGKRAAFLESIVEDHFMPP
jgi:hypothetical protein